MHINKFFGNREVPSKKKCTCEFDKVEVESIRLLCPPLPTIDNSLLSLADNIAKRGLLEPIKVYFDGENYYLLAGARRLAAHKLLGRKLILVRLYREICDLDSIFVAENVICQGKSILIAAQTAKYYREIRGFGVPQIADLFEMSAGEIERLLTISDFSWEDTRRLAASNATDADICAVSQISDPLTRSEVTAKLYAGESRVAQAMAQMHAEKSKPLFCPTGLLDNSFKRLARQISDIGKKVALEKSSGDGSIVYTVTITE